MPWPTGLDGVFRCINFTIDFYDLGYDPIFGSGYTPGLATWSPTLGINGKLTGGVLHAEIPGNGWCNPEDHEAAVNYSFGLNITIHSCKRLKVYVTGDGNGYFSSPSIVLRRVVTGDYVLYMTSEGSDSSCPSGTSPLITNPYYGLPNPAYVEPDCSYILSPDIADDGSLTYSDGGYYQLQIIGYNNFSDGYTFDVTLSLE